jgi:MerR family transcriptional regulator, mercuric resistance operon regulatory protein
MPQRSADAEAGRMGQNAKLELLSIGELSAATGCAAETIRFYERRGLLSEPPRTVSGRRVYGAAHVRQLGFVLRARTLGFSLDRIGLLARLAARADRPCAQARAITEAHVSELKGKIAQLQGLVTKLDALIGQCPPDGKGACPIITYLDAGEGRGA